MRHLALILTLVLSVQQANSQDYDKLISLADSSYEANNYILSGQYFDKAFNVDNRNHYDAYNAACSWALAGHLKSQWSYEEDTIKWFEEQMQPIFNNYKNNLAVHTNDNTLIKGKYEVNSLWINYMKSGDFNPPHNHTNADVSFVLYIDVPEKLLQEEREHEGTTDGPGSIEFVISHYLPKHFIGSYSFIPESGHMFIFPSELNHTVSPFKSNVIRTSVAGNLIFEHNK